MILNLLQANCPLDESIDSIKMESIRFCHSESGILKQILREIVEELPPWVKKYVKRQDDG